MTDMRRLLNIINETTSSNGAKKYEFLQSLLEGRKDQYQQMWDVLKPLVDLDPSTKPFYDRDFENALAFGRNDRIVWALKQYRQNFVNEWGVKNHGNAEDPRVAPILRKFPIRSTDRLTTRKLRMIEEHYLALPFSKIQNYVFQPNASVDQVYDDLLALEQEFIERKKGFVTQHEGDKIILTFPDGMCWMHLSRGGCPEEAAAMGHCGNGSGRRGESILSLREAKKEVDGVTYYEPFLTFILDGDGYLGEMKGKNNDKPVARYHPYIIALLKLPIIHGIKGGGYMPENNFALSDLPLEERKQLVKEKPDLGDFADIYALEGWTDLAKKKFFNEWDIAFGKRTATLAENGSIHYKVADNVRDFSVYYGDHSLNYWMEVINGERFLEADAYPELVEDSVGDLPAVQRLWLLKNLKKTIVDGGLDIEDEGFDEDDLEDASGSNIVRLTKAFDEDLYDELRGAVEDGMRYGTEREALKTIEDEISGLNLITGTMHIDRDWDKPVEIILTPDEAAKVLKSDDLYGDFRDFYENGKISFEHHRDFDDFDEAAFIERVREMIPSAERIRPPKGLLKLKRPRLIAFLKALAQRAKATRTSWYAIRDDDSDDELRRKLIKAVKAYYGVDLDKQEKIEQAATQRQAQNVAEPQPVMA